MNKKLAAFAFLGVILVAQGQVHAAQPLYQVSAVQTAAKAINYRELRGTVEINFVGTVLLSDAKGIAHVKNRGGVVEIDAKFENITSASQFGPEYLTYILWAISPDGRATNLGEVNLKDGRGKMKVSVPLQAFSLLVTAEPYFAVSQPSSVVIVENAIRADNDSKINLIDAKYELLPRGEYTKNMSTQDADAQVLDKDTPFSVYQARNAVRIAKAAGAEKYALDTLQNAQRLLTIAEKKEGGMKSRDMTARQSIQSAEAARLISMKSQAEDKQTNAEQQRNQAESDRVLAQEQTLKAVKTSAAAQADAEMARTDAALYKENAVAANNRAQKAEDEKAQMRAQLYAELNAVLKTRDTARGLIIEMSDSLFKTGSFELQSQVREKLSKISGIVSSHAGLNLSVEGFTDSIGSDEYNQILSEKRAKAARDYLVGQGVNENSIVSKGYGKGMPIDTNDTPQGRQNNRRVEIVITGDTIQVSSEPK